MSLCVGIHFRSSVCSSLLNKVSGVLRRCYATYWAPKHLQSVSSCFLLASATDSNFDVDPTNYTEWNRITESARLEKGCKIKSNHSPTSASPPLTPVTERLSRSKQGREK